MLTLLLLAACPTGVSYPGAEWPSKVDETKASKAAAIAALEEYAFTLIGEDKERKGFRTDGLVIIKDGVLIYERYGRGYDEKKRHISWSVSKTVSNALVARAVQLGKLKIDDSVCTYMESSNGEFCGRTVKNFLEFSSGIDWNEIYEDQSNQYSSVLALLYGEGRRDMVKFMAKHRYRAEAGESYAYSTGDSVIVAAAAKGALEKDYGHDWDRQVLYAPIGMKSAIMERDSKGVPAGGSWWYATPRDYARFGWLWLNDGCWAGQRLFPEGWVAASNTVSEGMKKQPIDRSDGEVYGWQFALNQRVPEVGQTTLPFPDLPEDMMLPRGHWGQYIGIFPTERVVVIRTGDDRAGYLDLNNFFKLALEVAK